MNWIRAALSTQIILIAIDLFATPNLIVELSVNIIPFLNVALINPKSA